MSNSSRITIFAPLITTVRSMKVVKVSKILRDLKKDGWILTRYRGSHREYKHSTKKGAVTVNGKDSDDVSGFLLRSIERQSGLEF